MDKYEKVTRGILIIIIVLMAIFSSINARDKRIKMEQKKESEVKVEMTDNYNLNLIKLINKKENVNYLISPYNIEIALNMLREGSSGKTKEEIDKVIGNRKINDVSIKDKVSIANALFVKDIYKKDVKKDFTDILNNKYKSEILYDKYETPKVINDWVYNKTNKMIDKLIDRIDNDFVMGLASALAIDVKWQSSFECQNTSEEKFTKEDNKIMLSEMMHKTYENNAKYFKTDLSEGIILPYDTEGNIELEFVGILPNSKVNEYVNKLTMEELNNIFKNTKEASNKVHIHLSLPRFTYSYDVNDFKKVLNDLGIKEAFSPSDANFKKMIEIDENVYVGEAIHKTKIELSEKGTKAAAVTGFIMYKNSAALDQQNYEDIFVEFNKPFVYMIREKNTGEILFFGTVFEPNKWKSSTCSNVE